MALAVYIYREMKEGRYTVRADREVRNTYSAL